MASVGFSFHIQSAQTTGISVPACAGSIFSLPLKSAKSVVAFAFSDQSPMRIMAHPEMHENTISVTGSKFQVSVVFDLRPLSAFSEKISLILFYESAGISAHCFYMRTACSM